MWCAYFCVGAYKHDVVVVIKMGAYIQAVLILCGCLLSRFYGSVPYLSELDLVTARAVILGSSGLHVLWNHTSHTNVVAVVLVLTLLSVSLLSLNITIMRMANNY